MKDISLLAIFTLITLSTFSQNSAEEVLDENFQKPFIEICEAMESYFKGKHPDLSFQEIALGEHRDGEFVKYKRWQHFWKSRLTQDGFLADLTFDKSKTQSHSKDLNLLSDAEWTNLSYTTDLGVQIGLGRTTSLAFHPTDPNTFYVGAAIGGIWKTTNGGESYVPLGDDLPYMAISSIVLNQENPDIIYIAISDHVWYGPPSIGVYKSEDGGLTWSETALQFEFSENIRVYWMTANPDDPETVFVGTSNGLFKTTDGFQSVEQIADGVVSDVKFKPGSSDVVYYVTQTDSFFKSTDGGETFIETDAAAPGSGRRRLIVTENNPEKVYVSANNMLYKSEDSGETFDGGTNIEESQVGNGIVLISPADENKLIVGNFNVWASEDGGNSFDMISDWLPNNDLPLIHVDQRNAFINPLQDDRVYLCNDGGVYTVDVNSNEFTNLSNGLQITQYYDIAVSQTDAGIVSGGSQDNGNVYSENGQWQYFAATGDGMTQAINPEDQNRRYWSYQNGGLQRWTNGNNTSITNGIPNDELNQTEWQTPFVLDPNNPSTIVAGFKNVFRSSNHGNDWEQISDNLPFLGSVDLLAIAPSNSERIYAVENYGTSTGDMFGFGHSSSRIYFKSIEDNEWDQESISVSENVEDIIVNPNDHEHVIISVGGYTDGHKVFQSFDSGDNWENISGDLPNVPASAITWFEDVDDVLFVGTDAGVYYTYAHAIDWREVGSLPHTFVTDLEIQSAEKLLRVGTHGRGIFETSIDVNFTSVEKPEVLDQDCLELYPNPADDIITINCLPEGGKVLILDANSKALFSSQDPRIDIKELSAGTYFAQVFSKDAKLVKTLRFMVR